MNLQQIFQAELALEKTVRAFATLTPLDPALPGLRDAMTLVTAVRKFAQVQADLQRDPRGAAGTKENAKSRRDLISACYPRQA
jgi:hypothetical protein